MYPLIILPGFSPKNQVWAEEIKDQLAPHFSTTVIYYDHWSTGNPQPDWIETEVQKIITIIGTQTVNLLAKSIGTAIAMQVVNQNPDLINQIILCGIPIHDLNPGDERYYLPLQTFPHHKVMCLQNQNDNHGSFTEAEHFLRTINPNIQIVSKPRSDHEYPYPQDFIKFLSK